MTQSELHELTLKDLKLMLKTELSEEENKLVNKVIAVKKFELEMRGYNSDKIFDECDR